MEPLQFREYQEGISLSGSLHFGNSCGLCFLYFILGNNFILFPLIVPTHLFHHFFESPHSNFLCISLNYWLCAAQLCLKFLVVCSTLYRRSGANKLRHLFEKSNFSEIKQFCTFSLTYMRISLCFCGEKQYTSYFLLRSSNPNYFSHLPSQLFCSFVSLVSILGIQRNIAYAYLILYFKVLLNFSEK